MPRNIARHWSIRLLGFCAVVPLLIGHSLSPGCIDAIENCTAIERSHAISGTSNPASFISIGSNLQIVTTMLNYMSPASAAGRTIPPIQYIHSYLESSGDASHVLFVNANSALAANTIGELWLHAVGKRIKLIHGAAAPSYLNAAFQIRDEQYDLPQASATIPRPAYVLSGGSTGSEDLVLEPQIDILLNGVSIYAHDFSTATVLDATGSHYVPYNVRPIQIPNSAAAGDELTIRLLAPNAGYRVLSSIWLHTPSGSGIKLVHAMRGQGVDAQNSMILDARFVLE